MTDEEIWSRYYAALLSNQRTRTVDDVGRAADAADIALACHRDRHPKPPETVTLRYPRQSRANDD